MQDVRDGLAPLTRPLYVALGVVNTTWFLVSLIPLSLVVALVFAALTEGDVVGLLKGVSKERWLKLGLCVLLDLAGDANEALPGGAKGLADVGFGPLDFFLLSKLFDTSLVIPLLGLLEEWLPGTDGLPLATVAWAVESFANDSILARLLGLTTTKTLDTPPPPE